MGFRDSRIPGSRVIDFELQIHRFCQNGYWIPSKSVDSEFRTKDSGFYALDSRFQRLTYAGSWIADSFTLGESVHFKVISSTQV